MLSLKVHIYLSDEFHYVAFGVKWNCGPVYGLRSSNFTAKTPLFNPVIISVPKGKE